MDACGRLIVAEGVHGRRRRRITGSPKGVHAPRCKRVRNWVEACSHIGEAIIHALEQLPPYLTEGAWMTQWLRRRRTQLLDPKLDLVFSRLFGAEQNRNLLVGLLNAVLRPQQPIVSVEVLPTWADTLELEIDGKPIALDLRVRLEGGEQIDVEMQ